MAINLEHNFITDKGLITLTKALNEKNKTQTSLIYSEINNTKASLELETSRINSELAETVAAINTEAGRAQEQELVLRTAITDNVNALSQTILENKLQSEADIKLEQANRLLAISEAETRVTDRINLLDKEINDANTGAIAQQINALKGTIKTHVDTQDTILSDKITEEAAARKQLSSDLNRTAEAINSRITSEIATVNSKVDALGNAANLITHLERKDNPHDVTAEQINAVTVDTFNETVDKLNVVENNVDLLQIDVAGNKADILAINTNLQTTNNQLADLDARKLNDEGQLTIKGGLTITKSPEAAFGELDGDLIVAGDIAVAGNLTVNGSTITKDTETLLVKDNFITINSDGADLAGKPAGAIIRTDAEKSYGIVYDINTDSVILGQGVTTEAGDFTFTASEGNPILTRAESSLISDRHLLIWDAENNKAIDGGLFDPEALDNKYSTWVAHEQLTGAINALSNTSEENGQLGRVTVVENTLANINEQLTEINNYNKSQDANISAVQEGLASRQLITDNSLKTTAKTIASAINEVQYNLQVHEMLLNNPHEVTWKQIYDQGNALSIENIDIGLVATETGSSGVSTRVARADHTHPYDLTRAPKNHASASQEYGVATNATYGHVIVDSAISDTSSNPIENKVIKQYVDDTVLGLSSPIFTGATNKTLTYIEQAAGKLAVVTYEPIQITTDQVTGYHDEINAIKGSIQSSYSSLYDYIKLVEGVADGAVEAVAEEVYRASDAERTLQDNIDQESSLRYGADESLDAKIDTVQTNLQNSIDSVSANLKTSTDQINILEKDVDALNDLAWTTWIDFAARDNQFTATIPAKINSYEELYEWLTDNNYTPQYSAGYKVDDAIVGGLAVFAAELMSLGDGRIALYGTHDPERIDGSINEQLLDLERYADKFFYSHSKSDLRKRFENIATTDRDTNILIESDGGIDHIELSIPAEIKDFDDLNIFMEAYAAPLKPVDDYVCLNGIQIYRPYIQYIGRETYICGSYEEASSSEHIRPLSDFTACVTFTPVEKDLKTKTLELEERVIAIDKHLLPESLRRGIERATWNIKHDHRIFTEETIFGIRIIQDSNTGEYIPVLATTDYGEIVE